jgi:hypothetical protein
MAIIKKQDYPISATMTRTFRIPFTRDLRDVFKSPNEVYEDTQVLGEDDYTIDLIPIRQWTRLELLLCLIRRTTPAYIPDGDKFLLANSQFYEEIGNQLHGVPEQHIPLSSRGIPCIFKVGTEEKINNEWNRKYAGLQRLISKIDNFSKNSRQRKFFNLLVMQGDLVANDQYSKDRYCLKTCAWEDEYTNGYTDDRDAETFCRNNMEKLIIEVLNPYQQYFSLPHFTWKHTQEFRYETRFIVELSTDLNFNAVTGVAKSPYQPIVSQACFRLGFALVDEAKLRIPGCPLRIADMLVITQTGTVFIIEVDGSSHDQTKQKDDEKDQRAYMHGIPTLRITNQDVLRGNEYIEHRIAQFVQKHFLLPVKL